VYDYAVYINRRLKDWNRHTSYMSRIPPRDSIAQATACNIKRYVCFRCHITNLYTYSNSITVIRQEEIDRRAIYYGMRAPRPA